MVSSRHLIQLLNHAENYKQLYTNHKNPLSLLFPYHCCAALSEVKIYSCLTIQRMTTEEVDVNNDESRHNYNFLTAFITAITQTEF